VALYGAQIAVDRFRRMEKKGRRTAARQRRGNLTRDDPGLAHARQNHAAATASEVLDGSLELAVQSGDQIENRGGFGLEHLAGQGQISHELHCRPRDRAWHILKSQMAESPYF